MSWDVEDLFQKNFLHSKGCFRIFFCFQFCSGSWDKMLKVWSAVPNPDEVAPEDEAGENPVKKKKTDGAKVPKRVSTVILRV